MKLIIFLIIFTNFNSHSQATTFQPSYQVIQLDSSTAKTGNSNEIYSVMSTVSQVLCPVGEMYDQEMKICHQNCSGELKFSNVTDSCEDEETLTRIARAGPCRNLTITPPYFTIDQEGRLEVKTANTTVILSPKNYQLSAGKATICFPLRPHFRACKRWGIFPREYELRDGGLKIWIIPYEQTVEAGEFFITDDKSAAVCISNASLENSPQTMERFRIIDIYATAWTISAVFLAISLIVYGSIPGKMKNHNKILISHMVSFLIFYTILIFRAWGPVLGAQVCFAYSFLIHYFFLAAFFWMNALAYDIWKNLPKFTANNLYSKNKTNRFLFMCLYAWGCPMVIAMAALLMDIFGPVESVYKPNFSQQCWFMTIESKAVFMFGPASVLIAANIIFFILTIVNLLDFGRDAFMVNRKIHVQLLKMYFKLMVVMGLCWTMEIISSLVGNFNRYWYLTDIINGLQGFFLFLVYVCKPSVLRDLIANWERRFGRLPGNKLKKTGRQSAPSRESSSSYCTNRETTSNITILPSSEQGLNNSECTQISTISPMAH